MDPFTLAHRITTLLAAAGQPGTSLGKRLRQATLDHPRCREALEELAEDPGDVDLQGQLRAQLKKLLKADTALAAELARLLPDSAAITYSASQGGNGALAQGTGAVAGGRLGVGGDLHGPVSVIENYLYFAEPLPAAELWREIARHRPAPDLAAATDRYLAHLVERYQYLDFRGMGITDRVALKLPLLQMYVPLRARREMPRGETWARELKVAGRAAGEAEQEAMGERLSAPLPIVGLLKETPGLIVLGDPGAGKTTFLKLLALAQATGRGDALGLEPRLPLLLPLSAYANALAQGDCPLDRFIDRYHRERGLDLPVADLLGQALERGGALLLLDGLDEVQDPARRRLVVDRVLDFFAFHRAAGNRFVLTSRLVGYPEVRPRVEGLAECTLVDLDDTEIEAFIEKWTAAIEAALRGAGEVAAFEARRERDELLDAVRHNPGVRALAANPLLLTILALMKRQGVALPERRVELYDNYVQTLLHGWNLARGLAGRGGAGLDPRETLRVLAPLSLWMHRTSPGVGLVKEGALRSELERVHRERGAADPEAEAAAFLEDVRRHSALLLDRGGRQYGFIHLTFQEYLAGVALARLGQEGIGPIADGLAAHLGDDTWHEASLLCIGYLALVQQRDQAAGALLEALLGRGAAGEGAILAREALVDIGEAGVPAETREQVVRALADTLVDDAAVPAPRRAEAGRVLARVGDPRPGVLEPDEMALCLVPAGVFLMGSNEGDEGAYDNEFPQGHYEIRYAYRIARLPVTVAQFRRYLQASGQRPGDPDSIAGPANRPVRWVSWHEALGFCRWLTQRWRERGWIGADRAVTLPSEPEWEKAARGGLMIPVSPVVRTAPSLAEAVALQENPQPARAYPWGGEADPNRANYARSAIGDPSAVGCFPGGASPYGVQELSGNLWEWTRSRWDRYPYPAEGDRLSEREDLSAYDRRVLRGGSFDNDPWFVRCAVRNSYDPGSRFSGVGFRVVVSPFSGL
jgi:formylglycine-generating enzyme required for sulfatase activity